MLCYSNSIAAKAAWAAGHLLGTRGRLLQPELKAVLVQLLQQGLESCSAMSWGTPVTGVLSWHTFALFPLPPLVPLKFEVKK